MTQKPTKISFFVENFVIVDLGFLGSSVNKGSGFLSRSPEKHYKVSVHMYQ